MIIVIIYVIAMALDLINWALVRSVITALKQSFRLAKILCSYAHTHTCTVADALPNMKIMKYLSLSAIALNSYC